MFLEEFLLLLQSPSTSPPLLCLVSWFPDIAISEEPAASSFRVKGSSRWVRFGGVRSQKTVILLLASVKVSHCNKPTGFIKGGKNLVLNSLSIILLYVCVRGGPNQPLHRDPQWSIVLSIILFLGILCRLPFKCSAKFEMCMDVQSHRTTH
jgi:hypothetical protein